jgi:hypothetical protein
MRAFIYAVLVISLLTLAAVVFDNVYNNDSTGPVPITAILILTALSLASVISLVLHRRNDKRKLVENLWLAFLCGLFTYLAADVVAGHLWIRRISPFIVADRYVHHKLQPNTNSEIQEREYEYVQRTNNLGLRGRDVDPAKSPRPFRVLMQGDSFTMGKGVKDDETFSVVLENSLRAKNVSVHGRPVEVLNGGVDSYAPILEFFQLTTQLAALHPDVVVLNFDMSDLMQESAYRALAMYGANGEMVGINGIRGKKEWSISRIKSGIERWINRRLYLTRLLLSYGGGQEERRTITVDNMVVGVSPRLLQHTLADDPEDRSTQWQNVFDSILKIKHYCRDNGIDFLLTVYPWGHQVNQKEWVPGRWRFITQNAATSDRSIRTLEEFARKNDIKVLDTFPAFRSYDDVSPLYYKHDMHWTPRGHRLMAQQLEQYLLENVLR